MNSLFQHKSLAFLRLKGPDALRFLNGQITQKVEATKDNHALWTAVTNAKGGIEGVGHIRQLAEDEYLFDCPLEIGDSMELRLDKYLIADDCEWSREDELWTLFTSLDPLNESIAHCIPFHSNRLGNETTELLLSAEHAVAALQDLPRELLTTEAFDYELERIKNCIPAWGKEIQIGSLPAECGLEQLALSFDKGCYIGQEIISRLKASGKTRKKLYFFESKSPHVIGQSLKNIHKKSMSVVTSMIKISNTYLILSITSTKQSK